MLTSLLLSIGLIVCHCSCCKLLCALCVGDDKWKYDKQKREHILYVCEYTCVCECVNCMTIIGVCVCIKINYSYRLV